MLIRLLLALLIVVAGRLILPGQVADSSSSKSTIQTQKIQALPAETTTSPEPQPVNSPTVEICRLPTPAHLSPEVVHVIQVENDPELLRYNGMNGDLLDQQVGLQMQTTTATPYGSVLRMRGFNGRYTQLLRDGFPIFGGLSSNFDFLQFSSLDLKQVEILKGPASTFFGGGGGAGAVNLVSKTPWSRRETLTQLSASSLGSTDMGIYFRAKPGPGCSVSNLLDLHLQRPLDADGDGFSDVPDIQRFHFNPQLSLFSRKRPFQAHVGTIYTRENRRGGDMGLVMNDPLPTVQPYLDQQNLERFGTMFNGKYFFGKNTLSLRNSQSWFSRLSQTREFSGSPERRFGGKQLNSFSELSLGREDERNMFLAGLSLNSESFHEGFLSDPSRVRDQEFLTMGAFVCDRLDLAKRLRIEAAMRVEAVQAKSDRAEGNREVFLLPRFAAIYRVTPRINARLAGSSGYRMPSLFSEESEALGFRGVRAVDFSAVRPEKTLGAQAALSYSSDRSSQKKLRLGADVLAFYLRIDNLVLLQPLGFASSEFRNYDAMAHSRGLELDLHLRWRTLELSGSYALNDTYLQDSTSYTALALVPDHAIKGRLGFRPSGNWFFSVNGNWKSSQWLNAGLQTRDILLLGATAERKFNHVAVFAHASNLLNTRQSRYQDMLSGPYGTPQFTQVWAPLYGFYFGAGIRVRV